MSHTFSDSYVQLFFDNQLPVPVAPEGDSAAPPNVLRTPAGSFCAPSPAPHNARNTSGVQTAEKSHSPKDDISVTPYSAGEPFADGGDRISRSHSRQLTDSPQIGARSPGQTSSWFVTNFFRISIFIIPRNFSERVISCPKRIFLTFRGTFGPQGGPTETWECSHSIRHRIPHNSMCSMVT